MVTLIEVSRTRSRPSVGFAHGGAPPHTPAVPVARLRSPARPHTHARGRHLRFSGLARPPRRAAHCRILIKRYQTYIFHWCSASARECGISRGACLF